MFFSRLFSLGPNHEYYPELVQVDHTWPVLSVSSDKVLSSEYQLFVESRDVSHGTVGFSFNLVYNARTS